MQKLQEWLERPSLANVYLTGRERDVWKQGVDFLCLAEQPSTTQFTSWMADFLIPRYHRLIGRHIGKPKASASQFGTNIAEYHDSSIAKAANLVGAVLASVLPVVAIVVLYLVKGMGKRLGLVGLFSAIFSTCLWFLNDGRLIEVFSATSA